MFMVQAWDWIFPLGESPDYEPAASTSTAARGVSPREEACDRLLDDDGHAMMLVALGNYQDNSLDTVGALMRRDDVVLGLGDGGAHYGMICDASFPTFLLAHWTRDRPTGRLSVAEAVRELTSVPAGVAGLADRAGSPSGTRPTSTSSTTPRCGCTNPSSCTICPPAVSGWTRPPTAMWPRWSRVSPA